MTTESRETYPLWMWWKMRRYVLTFLLFWGFFNVYSLRVNLSVAIVAMTEDRVDEETGESLGPEFDWNSKQQGYILSSFFYGYLLTQVIGGMLAKRISGHIILGIGIASTAVLTLLTPLAARAGFGILIACRVIMGLFEGVAFPCLHSIWSKWAPPLERSRMNSYVFAGNYIGTVVAMPASGVIAEYLGWDWIFYIFGAFGVLWYIIYLFVAKESPQKDPWISKEERDYILTSIGDTANKPSPKVPWGAMFSSTAVWAIIVAHFSENWGFYTLLTQLPKFLSDVMSYNIGTTGFIAGLPYLVMGILLFPSGYLADWVQIKGYMPTIRVRKVWNCGAFLAQCTCLLFAAFIMIPASSITFLTLGVGMGAFAVSGYAVNALDLAPQHAGVLMGISNTFGTIPGIASPILTGFIVQNKSSSEWKIVFIISGIIYMIGAVFYWFFAQAAQQPWALDEIDVIKKDKEQGYGAIELKNSIDKKGHTNEGIEMKE